MEGHVFAARVTSPGRRLLLASGLAGVRVFALSAVLSVLSVHALALGGTTFQAGLAFAAYALAAAVFQVPFGMAADRYGMRGALLAGLLLTAAGSILAAGATDVVTLTAGRALAGAGAVNGVAAALAADAYPVKRRTRALALFGASVGASFTLGLIAGPLLVPVLGARGLFLLQAALAATLVPVVLVAGLPGRGDTHAGAKPRSSGLAGLHAAGFATNFGLAVVLFAFPLAIAGLVDPATGQRLLALVVLLGGVAMFLTARIADAGRLRGVVATGLAAVAAGTALVLEGGALILIAVGAVAFFAGQSTLAAALPSAVSRFTATARSATQSMLTLAQTLGTAAGGLTAGALYHYAPSLAAIVLLLAVGAAFAAVRSLRSLGAGSSASVVEEVAPVATEGMHPASRPTSHGATEQRSNGERRR